MGKLMPGTKKLESGIPENLNFYVFSEVGTILKKYYGSSTVPSGGGVST